MLWLALYLPQLPLQSVVQTTSSTSSHDRGFSSGSSSSIGTNTANDTATVLFETHHGRALIYAVNQAANAAGIDCGMTLAASEALLSADTPLQSIERSPAQEIIALNHLARWATQFTPTISLQPPHGLLLEVEASLNLFGGIQALQEIITTKLEGLAYTAQQGLAPTPGGAWLLARHGQQQTVIGQRELQAVLMSLPLTLLELSREQNNAFRSMGLKTIADCLRLPRAGLNQRLGTDFLLKLDRILGQQPDPRKLYQAPAKFISQILLPNTVQETAPLLFVLQRLLQELSGFLTARGSGVQQIRLGLLAPRQSTEWLNLNLLSPSNDPNHWLALWQEKLDKHILKEPVEGIELQAPKLLPLKASNLDLFTTHHQQQSQNRQGLSAFLERLRNRLGEDCIQQLHCQDEHRPEQAHNATAYQADKKLPALSLPSKARPLWLFPQAQPLKITPEGLWHHGLLKLVDGPERIESGWWASLKARRDYYIATNPQQQTLWIYQDLTLPQEWFLHGYF